MPTPLDKLKKAESVECSDVADEYSDVDVITAPLDTQPVTPVAPLSPALISPAESIGETESVTTVSGVEAVIDGVHDSGNAAENSQKYASTSSALHNALSAKEEGERGARKSAEHGSGSKRSSAEMTERRLGSSFSESSLSTSMMGVSMSMKEKRQIEARLAIQQISRRSTDDDAAWMFARSWQLNPWHPENRVAAYLAHFGFEARDRNEWEETPKESCVELKVRLHQHVENADATWYQLECNIRQKKTSMEASWQAPRRLKQIRCSLHDRVSEALGSRYNWLFEDAHFALPFAPKGTTARLSLWFKALTDHINDGTLSPELVALTLFFLQVPLLKSDGEETSAPDFYSPSERDRSESLRSQG
mmetsp:Transcript_58020/g.92176  ORF Transcript_58020/g.92176 Transcript_58020/m.92176 type:complete len:363 (-) Transcript_58020:65-1153(-)